MYTFLDTTRITPRLLFPVELNLPMISNSGSKLHMRATLYPRRTQCIDRACYIIHIVYFEIQALLTTLFRVFILKVFISLTLALSTDKETICLLNNTGYYWIIAVTKRKSLITSTTGSSVQLLWGANWGVNIRTTINNVTLKPLVLFIKICFIRISRLKLATF